LNITSVVILCCLYFAFAAIIFLNVGISEITEYHFPSSY
jgi:hypothetical protein